MCDCACVLVCVWSRQVLDALCFMMLTVYTVIHVTDYTLEQQMRHHHIIFQFVVSQEDKLCVLIKCHRSPLTITDWI
jgi:hypothetical protein